MEYTPIALSPNSQEESELVIFRMSSIASVGNRMGHANSPGTCQCLIHLIHQRLFHATSSANQLHQFQVVAGPSHEPASSLESSKGLIQQNQIRELLHFESNLRLSLRPPLASMSSSLSDYTPRSMGKELKAHSS